MKVRAHMAAATLLGALALTFGAQAQSGGASEGPKFLHSDDESEHFIPALPHNPCHFFAPKGLRICPDGTGWTLERAHDPYTPGLYVLDDQANAAISLIKMPYNTAFDLTAAELEQQAKTHLFNDGPRGRLELVAEVSRKEDPIGRLVSLVAVAREPQGQPLLLQANLIKLNYGLGIVETRRRLSGPDPAPEVIAEAADMHLAFLDAITVSYNVISRSARPRSSP